MREEKGGKLKTKIRQIKQTTPPCQNIEKQNKQEKQTQLYRSETTELTRVTHGLWYVHRLQRWRRGEGRSHFCVSACSRCSATHTHVGEHTRAHAPHAGPTPPCTYTRTLHGSSTHRHAHGQWAKGGGLSPVRVFLYVIIGGGTIKEARVEGLPLLPSGEDSRDGAESHLLFLLFPFLVFKIL